MVTEASVAEPTTDGIGEKKVVDDVNTVEEESAPQPKETGESSETVQAGPEGYSTEGKKDGGPATGAGKKEGDGVPGAPATVDEEEKKDHEEAKASGGEVEANKEEEHTAAAAAVAVAVKEEAETDETVIAGEPKIEASEKEPEESTLQDKIVEEPSAAEVRKKGEEDREAPASVVLEDHTHVAAEDVVAEEQVKTGKESTADEPEITKAPAAVTDQSPTEAVLLEEQALPAEAEQPPVVRESDQDGQEEPTAAAPAVGDVGAGGRTDGIENDESGHGASDGLEKAAQVVDSSSSALPTPSIAAGESEKEAEAVVVTEAVEEPGEAEGAEKGPDVEEHEEEKANVTAEPTVAAAEETTDETGGAAGVADEVSPAEAVEKVAEEAATTVVHASRDVVLDRTKEEGDASIKEPASAPDVPEKHSTGTAITEKRDDETDRKTGAQSLELDESSKDVVAVSERTGDAAAAVAGKAESPAKPKTLISKMKHSIVKVKKAIIGKSSSSKPASAGVEG